MVRGCGSAREPLSGSLPAPPSKPSPSLTAMASPFSNSCNSAIAHTVGPAAVPPRQPSRPRLKLLHGPEGAPLQWQRERKHRVAPSGGRHGCRLRPVAAPSMRRRQAGCLPHPWLAGRWREAVGGSRAAAVVSNAAGWVARRARLN